MTASKAQWNQQLLLTAEWNPFCLSDLYSFIFWDLEPHGNLPHSWVTNTVSPLTCSLWHNLFAAQTFGLCSSQPPAYQLSPTYKISVYRMESSKMEAAFTIHFLFSVYLICQALKFGKLHFRTELKIQYCTLYRRKGISFRMWNPFVSGKRILEWFGLVGTLKTIQFQTLAPSRGGQIF